ncbi:restriction endonuclease subunit S [Clostridium botulinum]|uniref:restriction endonuclease subunit S n=1 Tax=Clostridium botulinum TaxID=1491 RepID=UPI000A691909|nr:restriction endonuclease subunit S [Clostridium botulinum]NFL38724.1 hypothetical protein [Clostridium botulinum]NFN09694.1 hypothetical protein [Clostridium botulinum]NFN31816.1 hypothetical protein [Clostridium botulinum]
MKSHYKLLGDYIREVNVRNTELKELDLLGISIQKKFIPSIANIIGTDMSKYKIVKKNQFAYGTVTSRNGDKISIALLQNCEEALISQAYISFEVIDENILLPEYLMMWFRREEFDRYARYMSYGSAREVFSWEEMCNVELPVPTIEKQKEIVKEYTTIMNKLKLNNKFMSLLENMAIDIYKDTFLNSNNIGENNYKKLRDIATITMGQSPDGSSYNNEGRGEVFYQGRTDFGFRYPNATTYTTQSKKIANKDEILISVRAPVGDLNIATEKCCIGRGIASIKSKNGYNSYVFYSLKLFKEKFSVANGEGTIFGSIKKNDLEELDVNYCEKKIIIFEEIVSIIDNKIRICEEQNKILISIKKLLYSKMAK